MEDVARGGINMNEQMKKLREEIEQTLNEERRPQGRGLIIEGWIEALEYVLGQIDVLEGEEE